MAIGLKQRQTPCNVLSKATIQLARPNFTSGESIPARRPCTPTKVPSICIWLCSGWLRVPMLCGFFFLHCRTSARHCRSTTGMSEERKQISPKAKANKNKHTTKQRPQNQTRQRSREICKKGETGETSASLSSPSQVLFRQVVLPHVVHV